MRSSVFFTGILLGLAASTANAGPTYYWTTVSPSQDIRSMSGFIEFEPGQEGYSYDINCYSGGIQYGSCSGTVNGVYYAISDDSNYVSPYFSPVKRINLSINGIAGMVTFDKTANAGPALGVLRGAGTFIQYRESMFSNFSMSDVNTVSNFASESQTCMGPPCNGPLVGYWTLDPASVPLPGTLALIGLGVMGIFAAPRRR